ncbi:MAG: VWA domain-containing protein [Ardenticatenales bacterium]
MPARRPFSLRLAPPTRLATALAVAVIAVVGRVLAHGDRDGLASPHPAHAQSDATPTTVYASPTAVPSATALPDGYSLLDRWSPEVPSGERLFHPAGIAFDASGRVAVAEAGNHRVTWARTNGEGFLPNESAKRFGGRGDQPGRFEAPEDVAVNAAGDRFYVADTGNRRVQVLDATGTALAEWPDVGLPRGIALGPGPDADGEPLADNRVYVSDAEGMRILVFAPDGTRVAAWGGPGHDTGQFDTPLGLAIDPAGDLVVADHGNERLQWLDADGSAGPAGAAIGTLDLDNRASPGGAPLDVDVDVNGDVYAAVDRAILRFRIVPPPPATRTAAPPLPTSARTRTPPPTPTTPPTPTPPPGVGVAAQLSFAESVPPVAEVIVAPCTPGECAPQNPRALGCYHRQVESGSHEGIQRIDLRPGIGLAVTYAPSTRWPDRVIIYPALRGGPGTPPDRGGITRAADQNVVVWPRQCREYDGAQRRHTTDPSRIAASNDPYFARTLDTTAETHAWRSTGAWYDVTRSLDAARGVDIAASLELPQVTAVLTGNQVAIASLRCLSGFGDDVCPPPPVNVLSLTQMIRRDKTNECRSALPIPWRPLVPDGPCIPSDSWWNNALAANGGLIGSAERPGGRVNAPHDYRIAVLNAGEQRASIRTLWVLPPDAVTPVAGGRARGADQVLQTADVRLGARTDPFRAWADIAYDARGELWALTRDGTVHHYDARGRDRGEQRLDGLGGRTAESLSIGPDGGLVVLTGDGWVMKFAPQDDAKPLPTATPTRTPRGTPRPTPTPRTTIPPAPTAQPSPHAVLKAAVRIADVAGPGRYRDLAAGPDDRVLVPDGASDDVLVLVPDSPGAEVTPPPRLAGAPCRFTPAKSAAPDRLPLGATTDVTLRLAGDCGEAHTAKDVIIALDASCQLGGDRLRNARLAIAALADAMALPDDRIGIVTFNDGIGDARLAVPLTADRDVIRAYAKAFTVDCHMDFACFSARTTLPHIGTFLWPYACTTDGRMSDGLRAAREALFGAAGRPAAGKAVVLLSPSLFDTPRILAILAQDPDTFDPPFTPTEQARWETERSALYDIPPQSERELALWEGWRLRDLGVEVWTSGVGQDSFGGGHPPDEGLLAALAYPADRYRPAAAPADLVPVFSTVGRTIAARVLARTLVVVDRIPADMALVPGTIRPPAEVLPDGARADAVLRWTLTDVPLTGPPDLTYTLRPLLAGRHATNIDAVADGTDGLDYPLHADYPVPFVDVVGPPTATATPEPTDPPPTAGPSPTGAATATPTPTPTPTPTIRPTRPAPTFGIAYLPFTLRAACKPQPRPVDVVLLVDTSSSMEGEKLFAAKDAATIFVDQLDLRSGGDRAAVIGFDETARVERTLTTSRGAIVRALEGLSTSVGTRLDLGLDAAAAELTGPRARAGADRAIVVLTDGRPQGGTEDAVRAAAARARAAAGAGIWAIGLGEDVLADVLTEVTGDATRVHLAPSPTELAVIYRAVASGIVCR